MSSKLKAQNLDWDTNYFGITTAQLLMIAKVEKKDFIEALSSLSDHDFIVIKCPSIEVANIKLIGENSTAFLADINIQFVKQIAGEISQMNEEDIHHGHVSEFDIESLLKISQFNFSRFFEDDNLKVRGGDKIYHQWLINSVSDANKFLVVHKDNDTVFSYLLYNIKEEIATIELIVVNPEITSKGLGTQIYCFFENLMINHGIKEIVVGTQLANTTAINFYHKNGFKQISSTHVYHLWQSSKEEK